MKHFLGIETSCDESSAAVVSARASTDGIQWQVQSLVTHSQVAIHHPYGGVVPEIASRSHLDTALPVVLRAITDAGLKAEDLTAVAVTNRPGLIGSLLVGVSTAKALAYALEKPLVAVHHLEGHMASVFLGSHAPLLDAHFAEKYLPMLIGVFSGGHSNLYLSKVRPEFWPVDFLKEATIGRSLDDAAGEAFDKVGKLLGLRYPAGPEIDRISKTGDSSRYSFSKPLPKGLDFSFSGLKTQAARLIEKLTKANKISEETPHVAASFQKAVIDSIFEKIAAGVSDNGVKSVAVVGGVAANSALRERLKSLPVPSFFPEMSYCSDNGAMIAAAGAIRFFQGSSLSFEDSLKLNAVPYPSH